MKDNPYLMFLQFCLDDSLPLPASSSKIEWKEMLAWAERQAIVGIIYGGITDVRCKRDDGKSKLKIPFDDLMEWIGYAQTIENQNRILNKKCANVASEYESAGFRCVILKGQGNAMMYPAYIKRTPGDIDVWIVNALRKDVKQYVESNKVVLGYHYEHIEYDENNIPIELHFVPGIMNNPIYNRRLQQWYNKKADEGFKMAELPDGVGEIPVPTVEFNIVFQLAHMMHHFFDEGIGLRQMIDYYYLLKSNGRSRMKEMSDTLKYLNLFNFAGAVMYIIKEVLGLDEKYLIVPVDERRGKTLLKEILKGGNFGKYSGLTQHSIGTKFFLKIWRNLHFIREYPAEALSEPFFRTWHFFWRLAH